MKKILLIILILVILSISATAIKVDKTITCPDKKIGVIEDDKEKCVKYKEPTRAYANIVVHGRVIINGVDQTVDEFPTKCCYLDDKKLSKINLKECDCIYYDNKGA